MKNIRIAFVSNGSPYSVASWSGTPYFTLAELERRFSEIEVIDTKHLDMIIMFLNRILIRIGIDLNRARIVNALYAFIVDSILSKCKYDVVVSIGATHKMCDSSSDVPILHVSDALFATITSTYPKYKRLSKSTLRAGNRIQQKMIDRSRAMLLSSKWACEDAKKHYRFSDKTNLVDSPLGANFIVPPSEFTPIERKEAPRFLFIGMTWKRKGGDVAVEVLRSIQKRYPDAQMDIVGLANPPLDGSVPNIKVHGYLDKSSERDREELTRLFRKASFLMVPSRQEAFGLVFVETFAHSRPPIACRVNGPGSLIRDGEDGLLFELDDAPETMATRIAEIWSDEAKYSEMCRRAWDAYAQKYSWHAWGERCEAEILKIVEKAET